MKSIQTKILTVVISGLMVITAIVSAIGVNMTHEIIHTDADRILDNVTQKEAAYINDVLGDITKSAAIMEHYAFTEVVSLERLADVDYRNDYLGKTKQMFQEIALNTSGFVGYFLRLNPAYTDPTTGFYYLIEDDGSIKEMQVTDLSKYAEDDQQNVSWYYTSVREGKAVWLSPYYFPGQEKQMISYTVPIYVDGELLGVLGFDMDFEYLVERVNSISVYENGYATLLASDGVTQYNNQDRENTEKPHTKATAALKNGMYLELRADYEDIQRNIRPMLGRIVMAFVVVLIGAIIYTVFVTHKIVKPLKQLTAAAEKLADGGSIEQDGVVINSKDEIGTLYTVLNNTYAKIQEYNAYINALAYRDSLTGIKNSTAYAEAMARLDQEINCGNPQFGVLVVDINNLKKTNDRYGHDMGNELIVHTAKLLTDTFKTSAIFRVGGDEFAVILTGKDYENYRAAVVRLDEACSQDYITVCEDRIPVSLARGVSIYDPSIDRVYKDVFAKADHAMYLHKEQSKLASV